VVLFVTLHDDRLSYFVKTPTCTGWTDRQTDRHTDAGHSMLAQRRVVKIILS